MSCSRAVNMTWSLIVVHSHGCYLISCHLCLTSLAGQSMNQYGVAWQLSRQRHPFPILSTVCGMQQNGWAPHNPAFIPVETDRVETIVEALVLCSGNPSRVPGLAAISSFQECLTCPQEETCMWQTVSVCWVAAQHQQECLMEA